MTPATSRSRQPSEPRAKPAARSQSPDTRTVRLPSGGYYDPDSASFDDVPLSDVESLFKATTPAEPAAVGTSAS